ncbi:unnamed protein product, partial [Owenia fusiformis]
PNGTLNPSGTLNQNNTLNPTSTFTNPVSTSPIGLPKESQLCQRNNEPIRAGLEPSHSGSLQSLTSEEVTQTLMANLGESKTINSTPTTCSLSEHIDMNRANLVSPHSTDLNFDAFELLDLPEFENLSADLTPHSLSSVANTQSLQQRPLLSTQGCANCLSPSSPSIKPSQEHLLQQQQLQQQKQLEQQHQHKVHPVMTQSSQGGKMHNVATITDFSPDWGSQQGSTKILVTGPWYSTNSSYSLMFDDVSVPAELIQSGVLRCFSPAHEAGLVTMQVACEGMVISNSCIYEYKATDSISTNQLDWFSIGDNKLKMLLLEKVEALEKRLSPRNPEHVLQHDKLISQPHDHFEEKLMCYIDSFIQCTWQKNSTVHMTAEKGLTILHMASALGYTGLMHTLRKWRTENSNLVLEYEMDTLGLDNNSCTPLMWACALGKSESALVLYNWDRSALSVCNKDGIVPLTAARDHHHFNLADQIDRLEMWCRNTEDSAKMESNVKSLNLNQLSTPPEQSKPSATFTPMSAAVNPDTFNMDLKKDTPRANWSSDLRIIIPKSDKNNHMLSNSSQSISKTPRIPRTSTPESSRKLCKRTSVEFLQGAVSHNTKPSHKSTNPAHSLRSVNSAPDVNLDAFKEHMYKQGNPMISNMATASQQDLNTFLMYLPQHSGKHNHSSPQYMDTGNKEMTSPLIDVERLSSDEEENLQSSASQGDASTNQIETLAKQIIAAMPERIKLSPNASDTAEEEMQVDQPTIRNEYRERSSSHSSFGSISSEMTNPYAEDSGICTPLGECTQYSFEDNYRYPNLDTPASSLSPESSSMQSPYHWSIDSPPPTAQEFLEYFNAPTFYMEKDFSQLTLSDQEQRKLYEAAKIIQNFFRQFRVEKRREQQRKEIDAAILIQSYYRRYKQYCYYKKMTQAAVLIQSQFRSYYAQKRFKRSRDAAMVIQNQYRTYKEHERFKKSRSAAVLIQQRFRSHYQRKRKAHQMARQGTHRHKSRWIK